MLPPGVSLWVYALLALPLRARLLANMTLSAKPELHNVLHCRQRRSEPRPHAACVENFVKCGHVVFEICERTDFVQTDIQTRSSQYFAPYRRRSKNITTNERNGQDKMCDTFSMMQASHVVSDRQWDGTRYIGAYWITREYVACIQTVKWRHSNLWSQDDLYVMGQHSILCEVKWYRFVALFE